MSIKNKAYYPLLLSFISGVLFWIGWPTKPLPFVLFFAFIPVLYLQEHFQNSGLKRRAAHFFLYSYLALLLWNVFTTYWIYNATSIGGIFAMVANALLMCIPLLFFYYTKKHTSERVGLIAFIIYWMAFEYLHLNWDLSWPWLTLGNAFASTPSLVQWYEYTGVFGGSFWILLGNVLIYSVIRRKGSLLIKLSIPALLILPAVISLFIYKNYEDQGSLVQVIVVQPNIDPYEEKFEGGKKFIPYDEQLARLISLSEKKISPETKYIVWPETALPFGYNEDELEHQLVIDTLKKFMARHPQACLVTGLDCYKIYLKKESRTAKPIGDHVHFYDSFNAAMQIDEHGKLTVYHKSKLVPGVEFVPDLLAPFVIDMGGGSGILGSQKERTVFFNAQKQGIAPIICYESIYGDFVRQYVKNGANMIFVITNDGWWGNTQGYRQHLLYGRLRAIETRKSIARAANTGISGFINQRGDIVEGSEYWKQDVLSASLKENSIRTFYTRHGDYLGIISLFLSGICVAGTFVLIRRKRKLNQA
ncbi:MAG: apolipoprotein N-acyltransferase [Cytophagaceae bacterium]